MKILYVSQYYPPEMGAPAARVSELARDWVRRGHEVTVLTAFAHHPHGRKAPADRGRLTRVENDRGIRVVRTYVYATRNAGLVRRSLSYLSFALSAILIGVWRVGRPDVVIATSPQIFTAVAGWWISRTRRAPLVFEVRDLWPESIVAVGALRDGPIVRSLKYLSAWLYRSADAVVTVGEGYRRRILAGYSISADKIGVLTNGVDLDRFRFRDEERCRVRRSLGLRHETLVLYLGTHGLAHGLETVLAAAERLSADPGVRFLFVGDGATKPALRRMAEERGLANVVFLPPKPKDAVVGLYAAADICLAPLRRADLFTDVLPSKIFETLAMRRALLLSVDGEARRLIERADAGIFVEPENPAALTAAIDRIRRDPELAQRLGSHGRRLVEERFDRRVLAGRYLRRLTALVPGSTGVMAPSRAKPKR